MRTVLDRLIREDTGQDLVEYALLLTLFGIALAGVWAGIAEAVAASYASSSTDVQDIWEPPAPGASP